jgi:5'-3' exonuclease
MSILNPESMDPTFIFIDGSYYCFYRYYSIMNWWKNAYPEEKLDDPFQNDKFVEKFKKTFVEKIEDLPKNLKIKKDVKPIMIVGKDCKRENIWRTELFPKYKANRDNMRGEDSFMGGPFFQMAYDDDLFVKGGVKAILKHPRLEADDCIAISVKYLTQKYPDCQIYIITSDHDYLQLNACNVHIFNLSFKKLEDSKTATGNAFNDLQLKIITGDKSDNIPSIFPKCGPKTAQKCIDDSEYFKKKLDEDSLYLKQYELNKKLVDFNNIPQELSNEFKISIGINV